MEPVTPKRRAQSDDFTVVVSDVDRADDPATTHHTPITPPPKRAFYLEPGTTLGEYRIEEPLGHGGMGVVFSAVHPKIGKRAAIKVLKKELCDPFNVERFVDEARVVNAIGHPNIVDVFAFGELEDGRSYYVMELLVGETLHKRIGRSVIPLGELCAVIKPLTRALDAAHAKGIVHRDLKPDNVFLVEVPGEWPLVKLLDFGVAKLDNTEHRSERTGTGVMVGTPQYIAPEQAKGRSTMDKRADIYALGCIMFEMLTGRPPFITDNAMEMVAMHLMETPPTPSSIVPTISRELDRLVLAMLNKDPDDRPTLVEIGARIDRLRLDTRPLDEATTFEFAVPGDDDSTVRVKELEPDVEPARVVTLQRLVTAPAAPASALSLHIEPRSGPYTTVEPIASVIEDTAKDVPAPRRLPWWLISLVVSVFAAAATFAVVKGVSSDDPDEAPAIATPSTNPPVPDPPSPQVADPIEAPLSGSAPAPVTDESGSAAPPVTGEVKHPAPPPPITPKPKPTVAPKPQTGVLQLEIRNAKTPTVHIDGVLVGHQARITRSFQLNQPHVIEISAEGRKPQRIPFKLSQPMTPIVVELESDLLPKLQQ